MICNGFCIPVKATDQPLIALTQAYRIKPATIVDLNIITKLVANLVARALSQGVVGCLG